MNGTLSRAAFSVSAAWATAFDMAAPKPLRLVSESMTQSFDKIRSSALMGYAAENQFYNGHQMVSGEVVVDLAYDNSDILEYCMGAAATTTYTFTDQLSKCFHLVIDKNLSSASAYRFQYAGCKVMSFSITGEVGETPVRLSMQIVARSQAISTTAFPTVAAHDEPVLFKHFTTAHLGLISAAISTGPAIKSFEISVDNALQVDAKDTTDTAYVIEPIRNGFRKVTVKLGLSRYLSTAPTSSLNGWKTGGNSLQLSLAATNGADTYAIAFPQMKIADGLGWSVGGPGVIETDLTLEAYRNTDNITPGTNYLVTDQMQIIAS